METAGEPKAAGWRVFVSRSRGGGKHLVQRAVSPVIHRGVVCVNGVGCGLNDTRALLDLTATAFDGRTGIASTAYTTDPDAAFLKVASAYVTASELRKPKPKPRKHRRPPHRHHEDR